jgi:hypothetical protein
MRRLTLEEVEKAFLECGWTLLSDYYVDAHTHLDAICSNGHITSTTWMNFKRGRGCRLCSDSVIPTIEQVKMEFAKQGCQLLENEYQNNAKLMKYRCSCGGIGSASYWKFRQGQRCRECMGQRIAKKITLPFEVKQKFCESKGCKLLSEWSENRRTYIEYQCVCGKIAKASWGNFKKCPNCWECGNRKKSKNLNYRWNPNREQIELNKLFQKRCYNLLSRSLKATNIDKIDCKHKILGYSPEELQKHILNHPNFNPNWVDWHIDHKFPIHAFIEHNILDLKVMNCLDNLQPMNGTHNLSKGATYDLQEFKNWLKEKNICI